MLTRSSSHVCGNKLEDPDLETNNIGSDGAQALAAVLISSEMQVLKSSRQFFYAVSHQIC